MSIIEDVLKRAGAEEVKVEDLRPGDRFVTTADQYATSGIFIHFDKRGYELEYLPEAGKTADEEGVFSTGQRWYLVERAPVEQPTGWGAIVEVAGVKYSLVPYEPQATNTWVSGVGSCDWEELIAEGAPKILFEGISE